MVSIRTGCIRTVDGRGIAKMADLKAARLDRLARQRHRGDGVSPDRGGWPDKDSDMKRERSSAASRQCDQGRQIDASFQSAGCRRRRSPTSPTRPHEVKLIDHAVTVAAMNKKYGNLYVRTRSRRTPTGNGRRQPPGDGDEHPWSRTSMDDKTAYNIVKTIRSQGRHRRCPQGKRSTSARQPEGGSDADPVPPGALSTTRKKASRSIERGGDDCERARRRQR
jgi:hypothetical protein